MNILRILVKSYANSTFRKQKGFCCKNNFTSKTNHHEIIMKGDITDVDFIELSQEVNGIQVLLACQEWHEIGTNSILTTILSKTKNPVIRMDTGFFLVSHPRFERGTP